MAGRFIDRVEARLAPHSKALSILAVAWFWLGVAFQARFLPLPALPPEVATILFWSGAVVNAVWWGYLRPAIHQRRAARVAPPGTD